MSVAPRSITAVGPAERRGVAHHLVDAGVGAEHDHAGERAVRSLGEGVGDELLGGVRPGRADRGRAVDHEDRRDALGGAAQHGVEERGDEECGDDRSADRRRAYHCRRPDADVAPGQHELDQDDRQQRLEHPREQRLDRSVASASARCDAVGSGEPAWRQLALVAAAG